MKSIYYAHAICMYGSSAEKDQVRLIKAKFPRTRLTNPARYRNHPEKQADTVGFCFRLIERCDALVFSRTLGKVTTGVGKEINHAIQLRKPVFEIKGERLLPRKAPVRYIGREATRQLYRRWHGINGWD